MTKFQNIGIVAVILTLVGAVYFFIDAPSLSADSENNSSYKSVAFDSLSPQDMDLIVAVKDGMKVATK